MNSNLEYRQNDKIVHRIKGSSFCYFQDEFQHSKSDISLLSPQNFTFKHFLYAEKDLEKEESKRFKSCHPMRFMKSHLYRR